ncbi:MAG: hypothetical protein ACK4UY_04645 [Dietzia sp.]
MGSLGVFAEGSSQFAINSGSTIVDVATGLPSFVLWMMDLIGIETSLDLTASVGGGI